MKLQETFMNMEEQQQEVEKGQQLSSPDKEGSGPDQTKANLLVVAATHRNRKLTEDSSDDDDSIVSVLEREAATRDLLDELDEGGVEAGDGCISEGSSSYDKAADKNNKVNVSCQQQQTSSSTTTTRRFLVRHRRIASRKTATISSSNQNHSFSSSKIQHEERQTTSDLQPMNRSESSIHSELQDSMTTSKAKLSTHQRPQSSCSGSLLLQSNHRGRRCSREGPRFEFRQYQAQGSGKTVGSPTPAPGPCSFMARMARCHSNPWPSLVGGSSVAGAANQNVGSPPSPSPGSPSLAATSNQPRGPLPPSGHQQHSVATPPFSGHSSSFTRRRLAGHSQSLRLQLTPPTLWFVSNQKLSLAFPYSLFLFLFLSLPLFIIYAACSSPASWPVRLLDNPTPCASVTKY